MDKIFKKICGFFCMMVVFVGISSVSASDYNVDDISSVSIGEDGSFEMSFEDKIYKITDKGDVNKDGKITLEDAQIILKFSTGTTVAGVSDAANEATFRTLADMNGDGNITIKDAQITLRIALKLEVDTRYASVLVPNGAIESLKYAVVTKDSEVYNTISEYLTLQQDITADDNSENNQKYTRLGELETNILNSLSSNMKTANGLKISDSIGTVEVDNFYLVYEVKFASGDSYKKITNYEIEIIKSQETTETEETEETVENPKTAVVVSVTSLLGILLVGSVVAKKKNLFNRI